MGCCDYNPAVAGSGIPGLPGSTGSAGGIGVRGSGGGGGSAPRGLLEQVGAALDRAIHGGDTGSAQGSGTGSGGGGSNIIPFPMVNAYKPAIQSRAPITGLTAFPVGVRTVPDESAQTTGIPDDEQGFSGLGGFGLGPFDTSVFEEYPATISNPGKLQTVIGGIAAILPATIQAIRANPSNIYPTQVYNPYNTAGSVYPGQGAGASIGAQVGGAAGNIGDTFSNIVTQHPLLVLGAGAALLLLFMNPPRRR